MFSFNQVLRFGLVLPLTALFSLITYSAELLPVACPLPAELNLNNRDCPLNWTCTGGSPENRAQRSQYLNLPTDVDRREVGVQLLANGQVECLYGKDSEFVTDRVFYILHFDPNGPKQKSGGDAYSSSTTPERLYACPLPNDWLYCDSCEQLLLLRDVGRMERYATIVHPDDVRDQKRYEKGVWEWRPQCLSLEYYTRNGVIIY